MAQTVESVSLIAAGMLLGASSLALANSLSGSKLTITHAYKIFVQCGDGSGDNTKALSFEQQAGPGRNQGYLSCVPR